MPKTSSFNNNLNIGMWNIQGLTEEKKTMNMQLC